jgi:hypothetical protein
MDACVLGKVEKSIFEWSRDFNEEESNEEKVLLEMHGFQKMCFDLQGSTKMKIIKEGKIPVDDYWCTLKDYPILRKIANVVFSCVASSAASERNFSTHKFIHSQVRNRLNCERTEKLVHIFFNSKNNLQDEVEFFDTFEQTE